ncbi:MAG: uroporphyrinogen-III synthase [Kofleriaceae bacterium]
MLRAVLTRDDVDSYAAAFKPLHIDVIAMPVTQQLADLEQREALARAVAAGPYHYTIVASRHAAIYLALALKKARRASSEDLAALEGRLGEIWAVGPATREALSLEGLTAQLANVHDGAALATELVASREVRDQSILVPRAEAGRTEAIEILRAAGAAITDVSTYRTHAIEATDPAVSAGRELLTGYGAAVCCVFAPSQVSALAAIVGPLAEVPAQFCAIGETTAAALRDAGVTCGVAATPTPAGLAEAVRVMLATLPPA